MPTQQQLAEQQKKARVARNEARELAELVAELEVDMSSPRPALRFALDLAGDAGALAQGLLTDVPVVGPITAGHLSLALGTAMRGVRAVASTPYSPLDFAMAPGDGAVKGAIGIAGRELAARRRAARLASQTPRPENDRDSQESPQPAAQKEKDAAES